MVATYQLYYNAETKAKLSPVAKPSNTSGVVTDLFEAYWMTKDYAGDIYGIISPEFERKTKKKIELIEAKIRSNTSFDVWVPITAKPVKYPNVWYTAERYHLGFLPIAATALDRAGFNVSIMSQPTYMLYCNYFWMTQKHWHQFKEQWLKPVIASMDRQLYFTPCRHNTSSGHTLQQLRKATGFGHYTWRPFICERLIGTYIFQNKLKVAYY